LRILHVVGARPNFMKVAPVIGALREHSGIQQVLVHTGQHYDVQMSGIFFEQLSIPEPDVNLGVGSGSHTWQTAQVMLSFESAVMEQKPDIVLVYGDINSTMAAALVCAKLQIPIGHVEAGLRSNDRTMPEEINRLVTDHISSLLFTPSIDGNENLLREGVKPENIHLVGNVMIDTLIHLLPEVDKSTILDILHLRNQRYILVTLHRPSNVDHDTILIEIVGKLDEISAYLPVIFPVHPRTLKKLESLNFTPKSSGLRFIEPLGYLDFLALQKQSTVVITDSGGVQEETTYLGVPCLTMRENTERPITVEIGTNILLGQDVKRLGNEVQAILDGEVKQSRIPPLWDGQTAIRIANILVNNRIILS